MLNLEELEKEVDTFISNMTGEDYDNFFKEKDRLNALAIFWEDNEFEGSFENFYKSFSLDPEDKDIIVLWGINGQYKKQYYIHKDNLIGIL